MILFVIGRMLNEKKKLYVNDVDDCVLMKRLYLLLPLQLLFVLVENYIKIGDE